MPDAADIALRANKHLTVHRWAEAAAEYESAIRLQPDFAEAHFNLGTVRFEQGRSDDARGCFRQAARLRPEKWWWRLREELVWPPVFSSSQEIAEQRAGLEAALERFGEFTASAEGVARVPVDELLGSGCFPPFVLSYQGCDNATLKRKFAEVLAPLFAADNARWQEQHRPPPPDGRVRLGVVVTRNHEHIFGRCGAPIVQRLPVERFETIVFCSERGREVLRTYLPDARIVFRPLPERLTLAAQVIRETNRDVVYYWEVGSDPFNYLLPFFRTAPLQVTSWGAQFTTGIPSVDRFLSSRLLHADEAARGGAHYTERLVLGDSLLAFEPRVEPIAPRTRASFGLPEDRRLYLCPQNLLKFHPDFDGLLAEILRRDGKGVVVCVAWPTPQVLALLRARWQRTMPDVAHRMVLIPRQRPADFRPLLALADVVLDTPHHSAGCTAYDIFAASHPLVTLPGEFAVGRYAQACYRKMGLEDLVPATAEAYVAQALRLGTDLEYRRYSQERIASARDVLYEDATAITDHERCFAE